VVPLLLAACAVSSISNPFKSGDDPGAPLPPAPGTAANAAVSPAAAPAPVLNGPGGNQCPPVVAWPHDRLVTVYEGGHTNDAQAIIHRGEITKLARECQFYGDRVVVKYGLAGRVLLGPKGKPGPVTLPISIKVADAERRVLAKESTQVSTVVPLENPVGYFSVVKEISFTIAMGSRVQDYKVFVAFGPGRGPG
jgi:hypothetical protein